ncbi:hypothetical protein R6Q59_024622 [Mikania micrantha]
MEVVPAMTTCARPCLTPRVNFRDLAENDNFDNRLRPKVKYCSTLHDRVPMGSDLRVQSTISGGSSNQAKRGVQKIKGMGKVARFRWNEGLTVLEALDMITHPDRSLYRLRVVLQNVGMDVEESKALWKKVIKHEDVISSVDIDVAREVVTMIAKVLVYQGKYHIEARLLIFCMLLPYGRM